MLSRMPEYRSASKVDRAAVKSRLKGVSRMTRKYHLRSTQELLDAKLAELAKLRAAHDKRGNLIGRLADQCQTLQNKLTPPPAPPEAHA